MSFQGADPYGTPGGTEVIARAQSPVDVRIAKGRSYIVFMRVNGPIIERLRENVEDVVRILGLSGLPLVAIIVRENGVVRDANASDVDFAAPLTATQIAPGVIVIDIAAAGIGTSEIANAAITLAKLASDSVDSSKIVNGSIIDADINAAAGIVGTKIAAAPNGVPTAGINDGAITAAKLAGTSLANMLHYAAIARDWLPALANASDVTWVTFLTVSEVFPAGTWEAVIDASMQVTDNAASGSVAAQLRLASPFVTTPIVGVAGVNTDRGNVGLSAKGTFVSNGVTAIVFTTEFRRDAAISNTVRAENGYISVVGRRVS
jgi:hypothetical protein